MGELQRTARRPVERDTAAVLEALGPPVAVAVAASSRATSHEAALR